METGLPIPIPPIHAMPHFIGGLFYGLTAENKLEEITACYTGGSAQYQEVEFALAEFGKGGWDNDL